MSGSISIRRRLPNDLAWIVGIACLGYAAVSIYVGRFADDAYAYWSCWRGDMYTRAPAAGGYLYSPAFAELIWPLAQAPWPVFAAVFVLANALVLGWLLRPLGWRWGVPLWLAGAPEIVAGNIFIFMAAIAVLGLARPALWALPALTKIAPTMGPVWFLVRREWRPLLVSAGATVGIALVSMALGPELWWQWFAFLGEHLLRTTGAVGSEFLPPLLLRAPVGLALVIWGALRDHRWTIPLGMFLCTPVLWLGSFALLAAIPRLRMSQGADPLPACFGWRSPSSADPGHTG